MSKTPPPLKIGQRHIIMLLLAPGRSIDSAQNKGANCILGLKIDLEQSSGKGMQMFMFNGIGTAVLIKKDETRTVV
jgi:hypothetical protein